MPRCDEVAATIIVKDGEGISVEGVVMGRRSRNCQQISIRTSELELSSNLKRQSAESTHIVLRQEQTVVCI